MERETYNVSDSNRGTIRVLPDDQSVGLVSRKPVISARHTSILSSTMLNEFTFGFTKTSPTGDIPFDNFDWGNRLFNPERTRMGSITVGDVDLIGHPREGSSWGQNTLTLKENFSRTSLSLRISER